MGGSVSIKEETNLITNPNFTDTGSDVVINGTFASDTDWNKNSNWTISGGEAISDGTSSASINQTSILTEGVSYKISFEITEFTSGTGYKVRAGAGTAYSTAVTSLGVHTFYQVATGNPLYGDTIYVVAVGNTIGKITNVKAEPLGEDWLPLPTDSDAASFTENGLKIVQASDLSKENKVYQPNVTEDNKSYKVTYTIHSSQYTSTNRLQYYNGLGYINLPEQDGGPHTFYYTRKGTLDNWYFNFRTDTDSATDFVIISSIVVQELGEDWVSVDDTNTFGANGLTMTSTEGTDVKIYQANVITSSKSYKVTYTIHENGLTGSNSLQYYTGDGTLSYEALPDQSVGTHTFYYTAPSVANDRWYFKLNLAGGSTSTTDTVTISSISVKEVGQDWTVQEGWTVEDNKAVCDGLFNNYIGQFFSLPTGSIKVTFEVDSYTSGTLKLWANIPAFTTIISVNTAGTYEAYFKTTSGANNLYFYSVAFVGSITNITVQQLDPNGYWNTNPNWLLEQGQAVSDGTNVGSLNQAGVTTLGKTYVAKYDILTYTSGTGFQQRVGSGSAYSDAETSIATHSTTQIATGNNYIYINPNNTIGSITNVSVRLKNTGAVTLTLTNQLTEKVTTVNLTPLLSNGRYTEFSYQPTGLIEGMYLIKFTGDSTTYAETLAYITTGTPPLGESEYKEYTTGDDNPDYVYIP